jgi:predicted transcriptional regulator
VIKTSEHPDVVGLTAEIVSAYVANNQIAPADLATLIAAVGRQLDQVGSEVEPPVEEQPKPAVPVRRSIKPDRLTCLACGKEQKLLKRHLAVEHDLTPVQYRERFGLKPDYPMAAPNYSRLRREFAMAIGLGRPKKRTGRARKPATPGGAAPAPQE